MPGPLAFDLLETPVVEECIDFPYRGIERKILGRNAKPSRKYATTRAADNLFR